MPSALDSTDKLFMKHSSKPYNPKLAGVFFKSGMIEAWGRGFDKIREVCAKYLELLRDDGHHDQNGYDVVMICAKKLLSCSKVNKIMTHKDLKAGDEKGSFAV